MKKFLIIFIFFPLLLSSQSNDNYFIKGNLNLNNNGVDWVPLFTLGEPSLIANFSLGKDRFSINPSFKYDLNGFQPWGFDIYWNYQLIRKEKFILDIGAFFPGTSFQRTEVEEDHLPKEILQPLVAFMPNLNMSFKLSEGFGLKFSYYEGFNVKKINQDHFDNGRLFFLTGVINNVDISDTIYINWIPQIYSVQIDEVSGIFAAQTLMLGFKNSPFKISSAMNKSVDMGTLSGKKFDINIGVNYSFELNFIKK